jgi:hypothetical protein
MEPSLLSRFDFLLPEVRMTSGLLLDELVRTTTGAADPFDHLPTKTTIAPIG